MWKKKFVVAAVVLAVASGCSAESETPEREQSTQSATRTVAYLSDAQQSVLVEEVKRIGPDVALDPDRVAEAMRSTCVAVLDGVPNLDRVAASYLTGGLQADLAEGVVLQLISVASDQEWCQR